MIGAGLWNNPGKRTKTDEEDENENKGENENKEESKEDVNKSNNMEEGKAEDHDQRRPSVDQKSQSNQSVSRKWSLTLEKSKFVEVVNDRREANRVSYPNKKKLHAGKIGFKTECTANTVYSKERVIHLRA